MKALGFSIGGAISSRTAMLEEFAALIAAVPPDAEAAAYRHAILDDNILHNCVPAVPIAESIGRQHFEDWMRKHAPAQYSESMFVSFSHNLYDSFHQFWRPSAANGPVRSPWLSRS